MIKNIFKSISKKILFLPIISFYFYNDINLITGISGAMLYVLYTYVYKLSVNDRYFAMFITPVNFIESLSESHKLVSYGVSTIHALFMSVNSTLYLTQIIDNYDIKQAFFISMSYYLADLYYIIDSSKKLTILDYFTICHHNIMIYFHIYVFNQTNPILEQFLLYYLNRGFIAEYSLLILNYSWYLVNTKQDNSKKMLISSIITIILYFITRTMNFTLLLYNVIYDDLILESIVILPLILINHYWFYKIICKAFIIYNKIEYKIEYKKNK
jgi:hypothetical protein